MADATWNGGGGGTVNKCDDKSPAVKILAGIVRFFTTGFNPPYKTTPPTHSQCVLSIISWWNVCKKMIERRGREVTEILEKLFAWYKLKQLFSGGIFSI